MMPLEPLFFDLFKGVLALFLLEMGLIAASQVQALRDRGLFLAVFGILAPVPLAAVGALVGWSIGLSVGGTTLLAVLAGSASYIAAPAAMRIAVPEANPSLSLTASVQHLCRHSPLLRDCKVPARHRSVGQCLT